MECDAGEGSEMKSGKWECIRRWMSRMATHIARRFAHCLERCMIPMWKIVFSSRYRDHGCRE